MTDGGLTKNIVRQPIPLMTNVPENGFDAQYEDYDSEVLDEANIGLNYPEKANS